MDQTAVHDEQVVDKRLEELVPFASFDVVVVDPRAAWLLLNEDAITIGLLLVQPVLDDVPEQGAAPIAIRGFSVAVRWVKPDEAGRHPDGLLVHPVLHPERCCSLDKGLVIATVARHEELIAATAAVRNLP